MSIQEAELAEARAALVAANIRHEELSRDFLRVCTKLGMIAAELGVDPSSSYAEFAATVKGKVAKLHREHTQA